MRTFCQFPLLIALVVFSAAAAAQEPTSPESGLSPPADDACLAAIRTRQPEADRTCSDLVAGLRYEGTATASGRQALAAALGNRALARMRVGDLEGAEADLGEALALTPDAWAIHLNRATLALRNGDGAAALNHLGRVRQLVPADSAAVAAADRNSILAWRMLGNLEAADALSRGQQVRVAPAPPPG